MDSNAAQFSREDDKECQGAPAAEEPSRPPGSGPQAVGEADPGCQSTTQDSSSHPIRMEGNPDCLVSGGIDWFEWSGLIDFSKSTTFESITAEFQRVKEYCQTRREPFVEVYLPEFGSVRVSRHGVNRGGERGQHFEYRIRIAGATFGLTPRSGEALSAGKSRQQANFYCLQTGRDCLLFGAKQGYEQAMKFLTVVGGTPVELKMSRGDLCLDVCDLSVGELYKLVAAGHFITDARSVQPHVNHVTETVTGFSAGKSPMRLCVYEKLIERIGKSDALYLQALIDRRWYGAIPNAAARIEYQMHRRWLVERGIATPEDFLNRRGALSAKLTHDWFRITTEPVDRANKHQSRATTDPIWHGVEKGFEAVFGSPEGPLTAIRRERILATKLAKQGRGCLANCLLQMNMPFATYAEFAEMCKRLVLSIPASGAQAADFIAELERRKMEFETS